MNVYDLSGMLFEIQIIITLLIMKTQCNWYVDNQTNSVTGQTISGSKWLNATALKKLKRWKIYINVNAKGCGHAKMSCVLDKHSVPQNLKGVGRTFSVPSIINL